MVALVEALAVGPKAGRAVHAVKVLAVPMVVPVLVDQAVRVDPVPSREVVVVQEVRRQIVARAGQVVLRVVVAQVARAVPRGVEAQGVQGVLVL